MAYCSHCGAYLADGARFCTRCGFPTAPLTAEQPSGRIRVKMLVWSIILTIACLPAGVVGLVFVIRAAKAPTANAERTALRRARIACTVGTVLVALVLLAIIAYAALIAYCVLLDRLMEFFETY